MSSYASEVPTCDELVREVCHQLTQKASIAYSYMIVLLDEEAYGFTSNEQKKTLELLKTEIESIRQINTILHNWLQMNT
jgi:ABC-type uncharacterized transport system ATPase subunit